MSKKNLKKDILKLIEKSPSFIVIFNEEKGNQVSYAQYDMVNGEIIVACEVVKSKIIKKCNKGIK